jgi:glycosyltransferase involved in cell wall biosynthesis
MNYEDRKLRILFITSDKFPPFRPAARAIFSEELVNRGHKIDWIIQAEKACNKSYRSEIGQGAAYVGATDDGKSRWHRLRKHALDIINDFRIIRLIKRDSYDLVQVKDKYLAALLALILSKLKGIKYFYWLAYPHAEASLYSAEKAYARYRWVTYLKGITYHFLIYKVILRFADHAFVQSEQMRRDIIAEGIPADKLTPIPGSVNLDQIPYRQFSGDGSQSPSHGYKKIVYIGTLMSVRRLDFLVRVMGIVIKKYPDAKLYLVGKGEQPKDEELLRSEIERMHLDHAIILTGQLPMQNTLAHVADADVCLSPYYPIPILNSTSPTKLVEYMAMGKPVVGNDHPEQSLVIKESGAGYSPAWSEDEFAESIIKLLDDPSLAKAMGEKGRHYVEKYRTNTRMADIVENKYYEVL